LNDCSHLIQRLILLRDALSTKTATRLQAWAQQHGIPVDIEENDLTSRATPDLAVDSSKQVLRVARHVGATLKPCTGRTDSLLCCNLHVLTQTVGCPLNCSYCILQSYQNRSQIVVYGDPEDIFGKLSQELAAQPRRLFRVCTGQVADSLALEPLVGFAKSAVEFFAGVSNAVLELKTKTANVDFLLNVVHGGRTIISFSVNPAQVIVGEEFGAASLAERLHAAQRAVEAGYLVAFHLDPMIAPLGDAALHVDLVRKIFSLIPASRVAYLSMGTVRFQPFMRRTITSRFPGTQVTQGELLTDIDGKVRLVSPLRVAIYRQVVNEVKRLASEVMIYFCMEPKRVWRKVFNEDIDHGRLVDWLLAKNLHQRFQLAPFEPHVDDYIWNSVDSTD
jgi:spore photoproduct lyase